MTSSPRSTEKLFWRSIELKLPRKRVALVAIAVVAGVMAGWMYQYQHADEVAMVLLSVWVVLALIGAYLAGRVGGYHHAAKKYVNLNLSVTKYYPCLCTHNMNSHSGKNFRGKCMAATGKNQDGICACQGYLPRIPEPKEIVS